MTALTISTAVGNAAESARVAVALPPGPATRGPAADTLEIVVSLQDIYEGVQGDSKFCAVAVALKRAGHSGLTVSELGVWADDVEYAATGEFREWLRIFDARRTWARPERFLLNPVQS